MSKQRANRFGSARRTSLSSAALVLIAQLAIWSLISSGPVQAQSVWIRAGDGLWNVASHWSPGGVPNSATTDVVIDSDVDEGVVVSLNISAAIRQLTIGGQDRLDILGGNSLTLHGDVTNDGIIAINPTNLSSTASVIAAQNLVLGGNGALRLRASGTRARLDSPAGVVITQLAGHRIEGVGTVRAALLNQGLVRADASLGAGSELVISTNHQRNAGRFEALAGSTLTIDSISVDNRGGILRADGTGAVVRLQGATIQGGRLETGSAGDITVSGTATLIDIENTGRLIVGGGNTVVAQGTLTNDGLIRINPNALSSTTTFRAGSDLSLEGAGTLQLGNSNTATRITAADGATLTQRLGHTIAGVGAIDAALVNQGTVRADASLGSGSTLTLRTDDKVNQHVMEAGASSQLLIQGITVANEAAEIRAMETGSIVTLNDARINGGTLKTDQGGTVEVSGSATLADVTNEANLRVSGGNTLIVEGVLTNQQLLHINPNALFSTTTFRAGSDLSLEGAGTLQLGNSNTATRITAADGATLTQRLGHTIAGVGAIDAALVNQGTVRADTSLGSGSTLTLKTDDKVNQHVMEAGASSQLLIQGITVANEAAEIRAMETGSIVTLNDARINGGTLKTDQGGTVEVSGSATLADVTNEANLRVSGGNTLIAEGVLTNQQLLHINPNALSSTTTFRAGSDLVLEGAGTLQLGNSNTATRITAADGATLTQRLGHTIAGVGAIDAALVNQGTVRADASLGSGSTLTLKTDDKVNQHIMEAVAGSNLVIDGITVHNAGAEIRAVGSGSFVTLAGSRIEGGTLTASAGGLFSVSGTATLANLTQQANLLVSGGNNLLAEGTLINDGVIRINPTGLSSTTTFDARGDLVLEGEGRLQLERSTTATRITTADGTTLTQRLGHTIVGVGSIDAAMINQGLVRADASLGSGSNLTLRGSDKVNQHIMEAVAGSQLLIDRITVDNSGAEIRAVGSGSFVTLAGSRIEGGTLTASDGGLFNVSGTGTLANLTQQANLLVSGGNNLLAEGTLINDGVIRINPTAISSTTTFNASRDLSLGGSGSVDLGRTLSSARITTAADATLTQEASHTIRGVGRVEANLVNLGLVQADSRLGSGSELRLADGQKTNWGTFQAAQGTLRVDAGLLTNFDAATGSLLGGNYEVLSGGDMRLVGVAVDQLDARVLLQGTSARLTRDEAGTVNALSTLRTIGSTGSLALRDGHQMTRSGDLTQFGSLEIDGGGGRLLITGDWSQLAGRTQLSRGGELRLQGNNNLLLGGELAGNGTIRGNLSLGDGARLSPGLSAGLLDIDGTLTWNAGGTIRFDLGQSVSESDLLQITGNLLKDGQGSWAFDFIDNGWQVGTTYDLIAFGSTNFNAADFTYTNPGPFSGRFLITDGSRLQFTLTAVPEPSTWLMLTVAAVGFAAAHPRLRRRLLARQLAA
jgi:hypothetical protein